MGVYIIKIKDKYLEWSTIVDAPVTYGMSLDEFKEYYRQRYGEFRIRGLGSRLELVEKKGSSDLEGMTVEDVIRFNRSGEDESCITMDEIYQKYCVDRK